MKDLADTGPAMTLLLDKEMKREESEVVAVVAWVAFRACSWSVRWHNMILSLWEVSISDQRATADCILSPETPESQIRISV